MKFSLYHGLGEQESKAIEAVGAVHVEGVTYETNLNFWLAIMELSQYVNVQIIKGEFVAISSISFKQR